MGLLVYFTENLELKDSVTKNKSRKHSWSTRKTVIDNSYIVGVSEIDENNCKVILDKKAVGDDNILYVVGKIDEITDDIDGWLKYYIRAKLYKTERDWWKDGR